MVVKEIQSPEEFKAEIEGNPLVVVDFSATWCGPCKMIAPIYSKQSDSEENKDIVFLKVDVDEVPEVAQEYEVSSMPTFLLFKDGKVAATVIGARPPNLLAGLAKLNESKEVKAEE